MPSCNRCYPEKHTLGIEEGGKGGDTTIVKKFGKDFRSGGGALTLDEDEVNGDRIGDFVYVKKHDDGWVIVGEIHEDYFTWVNDFVAYNIKQYGWWVAGDFEKEVVASCEEAFNDFYEKHKPEEWDYGDI